MPTERVFVPDAIRYRAIAFVPGEGASMTLDCRERDVALEHARRWSRDGFGAVVFRVDGGHPEQIWPEEAVA